MNRRSFLIRIIGFMAIMGAKIHGGNAGIRVRHGRQFHARYESGASKTLPQKSSLDPWKRRAVIVRNPMVISNDLSQNVYVDQIVQEKVDEMLATGILALTGSDDIGEAWKTILSGYRHGHIIAMKPNFNGVHRNFGEIVTTPQLINAVVRSIITAVGAIPSQFVVYDISRPIPDNYRRRIIRGVRFVEGWASSFPRRVWGKIAGNTMKSPDPDSEVKMPHLSSVSKGDEKIKCFLPKVLSEADHLINLPILKAHVFMPVSSSLKNHFGSVVFSHGKSIADCLHPPHTCDAIVDINCHHGIKDKTRLVIMDALAGVYRWPCVGRAVQSWRSYPDVGSPASLVLSFDPLAIEAASVQFINQERKLLPSVDELGPLPYQGEAVRRGIGADSWDWVEVKKR